MSDGALQRFFSMSIWWALVPDCIEIGNHSRRNLKQRRPKILSKMRERRCSRDQCAGWQLLSPFSMWLVILSAARVRVRNDRNFDFGTRGDGRESVVGEPTRLAVFINCPCCVDISCTVLHHIVYAGGAINRFLVDLLAKGAILIALQQVLFRDSIQAVAGCCDREIA